MKPTITFDVAEGLEFVTNSRRPIVDGQGIVVNSFLDEREWAELDAEIIRMVKLRLNAVQDIFAAGLRRDTTLATLLSQWRVGSERIRPTVSMDGRSRADRDRTDRKVYGVPVPIIRTDYEIGRRELLASRRLGAALDVFEAGEAAASVAEEQEYILFNGSTPVVQGNSIYGYTTLPARETGTAGGSYGGGDFGTISNIFPTFRGVLAAMAAKRYHGPFMAYISQNQYHEMLSVYSDGSTDSALTRVLRLPQISGVKASDFLADTNMVLVQMTSNVVDIIVAQDIENREWESPDMQALHFAVMAAMSPRLKTDYAGNAGIAHVTAC